MNLLSKIAFVAALAGIASLGLFVPIADVAAALPLGDTLSQAGLAFAGIPLTTLAADKPRRKVTAGTDIDEYPVVAADILYEGSAIGLVDASGHARPLTTADRFVGFAETKCDNSAGSAADKNVRVRARGQVQLSVTGALITDVGLPVYASDDDTFTLNPASGVFIGFVSRFVSSGVAIVAFDAVNFKDPWGAYKHRETLSGTKTFDAEDSGKLFCVDADADGDALTLPAVADGFAGATILAVGAFGTTALTIDPAATDNIRGPDITAADDKDVVLTKATQRRGDFVTLHGGDADGYVITEMRGTWARQA